MVPTITLSWIMLFGDQVIKLAIHMSGKDILKCNTKAIKTIHYMNDEIKCIIFLSIYLSTTIISDTSQSTLSVRKPIIPDRSLKAKVLLRSSNLYEAGKDAQPDEIEQVCVYILTILLFIILSSTCCYIPALVEQSIIIYTDSRY